jgi:hypothetical protein
MVKVVFRIFASLIPLGIVIVLIWLNVNLLSISTGVAEGRIKQLNFIGHSIDGGADIDMQNMYPEGYMFLNCLYGLAWCDALNDLQLDTAIVARGLIQLNNSIARVQSDQARAIFSSELNLPYGAFYVGWSNYLLGRRLQVNKADTTGLHRFKDTCDQIARAVNSEIYPESYSSMAWPADAVVCVASLALHDQLAERKYNETIRSWITNVRKQPDPRGLIPHSALSSGKPIQGARGSSQCLMLSFLKEIDSAFATEQFQLFKEHFVDTRFGLTGVREYPSGVNGLGDVDSGPVIFGMGGAASIVGIRTLGMYQHQEAHELLHGIEALALPLENETEKKYLLGTLPMADAFIVWSQGGVDTDSGNASNGPTLPWKFIAFSMMIILLCGGLIYLFWR